MIHKFLDQLLSLNRIKNFDDFISKNSLYYSHPDGSKNIIKEVLYINIEEIEYGGQHKLTIERFFKVVEWLEEIFLYFNPDDKRPRFYYKAHNLMPEQKYKIGIFKPHEQTIKLIAPTLPITYSQGFIMSMMDVNEYELRIYADLNEYYMI